MWRRITFSVVIVLSSLAISTYAYAWMASFANWKAAAAVVYNWASTALSFTLNNPTPAINDYFGGYIAIDGNIMVTSAYSDDATFASQGTAYLYNVSTGALTFTLNNPTPAASDLFGTGVDVSGNNVVVCASSDSTGATRAGSCYIFDGTTGSLLTTINNPTPALNEYFGSSVGIDGNYLIIGASGESTGGASSGAAYIYDTIGTLLYTLANPTPAASDVFGFSAAISGNIAVVGARLDDTGATDAGSVYLYDVTTGALLFTINNPSPVASDKFGTQVSISGNLVAIGAPEKDTGASNAGVVYIYDATTGSLLRTINNPSPTANDEMGGSGIAINGDILVVGVSKDDTGASSAGLVYIFNASTGSLLKTVSPPLATASDLFGDDVDISANKVAIGAYGNDTGASGAGQAYIYTAP